MDWTAFGFVGKVVAFFPSSRINSLRYGDLLKDNLLSFIGSNGGVFEMIYQKKAFFATANNTWEWLQNNEST